MGNLFSKNGAITKIVEAVPLGGFITAPFHAAAGNARHAVQAAIGGFGSLTGAIAGPVASVVASMGTAGLASILDNVGVDEPQRIAVKAAVNKSDYEKAAKILVDVGKKKVSDNSRQMSAESGGRRSIKSVHGTFLRAYDREWKVDMARSEGAWEHWYIEDHKGKVVFKAIHSPGRFLRCNENGKVDLVDRLMDGVYWSPLKNDNGSWSFLSIHGSWLSARQDGSVGTVKDCDTWEQFWLGRW